MRTAGKLRTEDGADCRMKAADQAKMQTTDSG